MILTISFEKSQLIKVSNNFLSARRQFVSFLKRSTNKFRTVLIKIREFKSDDDEESSNITIEKLTNEDS